MWDRDDTRGALEICQKFPRSILVFCIRARTIDEISDVLREFHCRSSINTQGILSLHPSAESGGYIGPSDDLSNYKYYERRDALGY